MKHATISEVMMRLPAALALCFLLMGCQSKPHPNLHQEGERDWTDLRGGMKFRLANQQLETGRIADAVRSLEGAIQLNPRQPEYYHALARCRLEQGDTGAAMAVLGMSEEAGDASAELAYLRGLAAEQEWRLERARDHYAAAVELGPRNIDYVIALAQCLTALDMPAEARALIDARMDRFDHTARLVLLRGEVCTVLGDLDSAARDFGSLISMLGDDPMVAGQYARILVRLGRHAEAIAALRALLEGPKAAEGRGGDAGLTAVHTLAEAYIAVDNANAAQRLLLTHLAEHGTDTRAWWLLANAAVRTGDPRTVRHCLRQGRSLAPHRPHWDVLDAYLALRNDDQSEAIRILRAAAGEHPDDALVRGFLGALRFEDERAPVLYGPPRPSLIP